jgi:hypothetical protein
METQWKGQNGASKSPKQNHDNTFSLISISSNILCACSRNNQLYENKIKLEPFDPVAQARLEQSDDHLQKTKI